MKELSKEMQMVYDYCQKQKDCMDTIAENSPGELGMMFSQQATCYWAVQQFIEVNFMEEENDNATD